MSKFLNISTDNTLGGNSASDESISSQKAVKDYVDKTFLNYGVCDTTNSTQTKVVTIDGFKLVTGVCVRVKFTNNQNYNGAFNLNVNGTGAISVKTVGTSNSVRWSYRAGEVVSFTYDGANWIMDDAGTADVNYYGYTKLQTSATSTSVALALTPSSLNQLVQGMIEPYNVYSASATYAVGDRVRYNYQAWECNTAITTAEAWTAAHWTALDPLQTQIDRKQDKLISGTNIKTINSNSILGSGNLDIVGLPSQTGQSGKFLTTNGTTASWGTPASGSKVYPDYANAYDLTKQNGTAPADGWLFFGNKVNTTLTIEVGNLSFSCGVYDRSQRLLRVKSGTPYSSTKWTSADVLKFIPETT